MPRRSGTRPGSPDHTRRRSSQAESTDSPSEAVSHELLGCHSGVTQTHREPPKPSALEPAGTQHFSRSAETGRDRLRHLKIAVSTVRFCPSPSPSQDTSGCIDGSGGPVLLGDSTTFRAVHSFGAASKTLRTSRWARLAPRPTRLWELTSGRGTRGGAHEDGRRYDHRCQPLLADHALLLLELEGGLIPR
jgi:hypothetical protein